MRNLNIAELDFVVGGRGGGGAGGDRGAGDSRGNKNSGGNDVWLAIARDSEGNLIGLMSERPSS